MKIIKQSQLRVVEISILNPLSSIPRKIKVHIYQSTEVKVGNNNKLKWVELHVKTLTLNHNWSLALALITSLKINECVNTPLNLLFWMYRNWPKHVIWKIFNYIFINASFIMDIVPQCLDGLTRVLKCHLAIGNLNFSFRPLCFLLDNPLCNTK